MSRLIRVALAVVFSPEGRVLVQRRGGSDSLAGTWELPGGKIEPGETPEEAARREAREELGIETIPIRILAVHRHDYANDAVELTAVECRMTPPDRALPESPESAWETFSELKKLQVPGANFALFDLIEEARGIDRLDEPSNI